MVINWFEHRLRRQYQEIAHPTRLGFDETLRSDESQTHKPLEIIDDWIRH